MRLGQFQIGRIFGIPVIIDYGWFPVALLHVWLLSQLWLPSRVSPPWPGWQNLLLGFIITVLFFASVLAHELAHSLIARLEGIGIHDIQLHIFGGWARLIGEPRTPMAEFRVAVAGPASSFMLSLVFTAGLLIFQQIGPGLWISNHGIEVCFYLVWANFFLATFNLLPGLPLDGGRALRALLWQKRKDILSATRTAKRMGVVIAYTIMSYGFFTIIYGISRGSLWRDLMMALWLLVIGLFLKNAAESDYRYREQRAADENEAHRRLETWKIDGTVGSVMEAPAISVPPEYRIIEFIDRVLAEHKQIIFPVARDGRLHGVLSLRRLRDLPRESWDEIMVRDAMEPISEDLFVTVRSSIEHAEYKLKTNGMDYLAVVDPDGFLVGSLTSGGLKRSN